MEGFSPELGTGKSARRSPRSNDNDRSAFGLHSGQEGQNFCSLGLLSEKWSLRRQMMAPGSGIAERL